MQLVVEQGPVEISEGIGAVKLYSPCHVRKGIEVALLCGVNPAAADVALRLEAVELEGAVVIFKSLESVAQKQVRSAPVKESRRILGLLADITVEIFNCLGEAPGQEIGDSAAVVKAVEAGPQAYGFVEVGESLFIIARTALCNRPVMVSVGEYRVKAHGGVEISLGAADITQVVFCNAPEKEAPVVGAVKSGKNVEMFNSLGIFPILQGEAPAHSENVFVVLGKGREGVGEQNRYCQEKLFHYFCKDKHLSCRIEAYLQNNCLPGAARGRVPAAAGLSQGGCGALERSSA